MHILALLGVLLVHALNSRSVESSEVFTAVTHMVHSARLEKALAFSLSQHIKHTEARLTELRQLLKELRANVARPPIQVTGAREGEGKTRDEDDGDEKWWYRPTSSMRLMAKLGRIQMSLRRHFRDEPSELDGRLINDDDASLEERPDVTSVSLKGKQVVKDSDSKYQKVTSDVKPHV